MQAISIGARQLRAHRLPFELIVSEFLRDAMRDLSYEPQVICPTRVWDFCQQRGFQSLRMIATRS